jgi:hypothetical protein
LGHVHFLSNPLKFTESDGPPGVKYLLHLKQRH